MENMPNWIAWLFLVLGVIYLIADFGTFSFPVSWWSALFILFGLAHVVPMK